MSVLIKEMKMPQTCTMCWLSPICPVWVKEVSRYKGYDNRLPNCPLIEVPTPHGRLIDADRIDRDFSDLRWEDGDWRTGKLKHWGDRPDWCLTGAEVESLITAAPTIIEAEEE